MSQGRQNQLTGKHGEALAESVMNGLGIEKIEKISTPVILTPYHDGHKIVGGVFRVKHGEKVSGDRRGVLPDGTSVVIEVKTIKDDRLIYSELKAHQHRSLAEFCLFNALAVLVWVHGSGVYVMKYDILNFQPRTSIDPERAGDVHRKTVAWIKNKIRSLRR